MKKRFWTPSNQVPANARSSHSGSTSHGLRTLSLWLFVVMLCLAWSSTSFATGSRINSMGGGSKNITVDDDHNIWNFPSTIVKWGNRAVIDRFNGTTGEFGVNYGLNQDAVLIVYGGDHQDRAFSYGGAAANSSSCGTACSGNGNTYKGSIGFGWNASGTKFGAILSVYGDNQKTPDTPSRGPLGMGIDFGASIGDLDFTVGLLYGALNDETKAYGGGDGHTESGLLLRYTSNVAPGIDAIPYLDFNLHSKSIRFDNITRKDSSLGFDLGSDLKIQPANDIYIYPGVGIAFQMDTEGPDNGESETYNLALPYFSLGLDAKITEWLDFRMGASQTDEYKTVDACANGETQCQESSTSKDSDVRLIYTAGFGLQFSDLIIDLNLNPQFFNNGLYFVNGSETSQFGVDVALLYTW